MTVMLAYEQTDASDCGAAALTFLQRFSTLDSTRETLLAYGSTETAADAAATAAAEPSRRGMTASAAELCFWDCATGRYTLERLHICALAMDPHAWWAQPWSLTLLPSLSLYEQDVCMW
jgi:hypothetical protein